LSIKYAEVKGLAMAEFDAHETIEDAIDAAARGLVKKSSDEIGRSVEYFSLKELADEQARQKANSAAAKSHFGIRMSKCVPPSTG